jgi:hypothetical protein
MDACTSVDGDHQPSQGDYTVCIECEGIAVFDAQLTLRAPSRDALGSLSKQERATIEAAQYAVRKIKES